VHSCTQVNLKRHDNTFGLISPIRTFYLQAATPQEVQNWVTVIEDARHTLWATSTVNSVSTPIPIPQSQGSGYRGPFPPSSLSAHFSPQAITSSDSEDAISTSQRTQPVTSVQGVSLTPSKSPKDPTKVILSGYLMKCGSKRRNWRKRWFVLTGEKLVYSRSHMVNCSLYRLCSSLS
jgi:pleckstrin homology domain-containing family A member 1/2